MQWNVWKCQLSQEIVRRFLVQVKPNCPCIVQLLFFIHGVTLIAKKLSLQSSQTHTLTPTKHWVCKNLNADLPSKTKKRFNMSKHEAAWKWYCSRWNVKKCDKKLSGKRTKTSLKTCLKVQILPKGLDRFTYWLTRWIQSVEVNDLLTEASTPDGWKWHFLRRDSHSRMWFCHSLRKDSQQNAVLS